jgi:DNA (cytosine-5)-methyltransferase 1
MLERLPTTLEVETAATPRSARLRKRPASSSSLRAASVKLRCIDLFAGAGGLSLAAQKAGLEVAAAVEIHPKACETYRSNIVRKGGPVLYEDDILQLDPEDLKRRHFPDDAACDVVLGGPPCQGFSTHRIKDAGVGDPRNALILRYFSFVAALRPKVFLMENVPGILWPRHRQFLETFYKHGAAAGYDVKAPVVLDARDFGVPQRRRRVFILGVARGHEVGDFWPPSATHGSREAIELNPRLKPWVSASEVFSYPAAASDINNVHMNHSKALVDAFRSTPRNGGSRNQSNRTLPCHTGHDGHWDVYGRIDPNEPGPTMTTACINPSKGRFVHPTEHHGITVRQAARFQTFPDSFVFKGGLISAGEQIGNAVPVQLGTVLLRAIRRAIEGATKKQTSSRRG